MHFGQMNGRRFSLASTLPVRQVVGSLAPDAQPLPTVGECSSDGLFIWKQTSDGSGYWARRSAAETDVCNGTWTGSSPTVTVHTGQDPLDTNFGPFRAGPFSLPASPVNASYVRFIRFDGSAPIPEPAASYLHALLQIAPPTIQIESRTLGPIDLSKAFGTMWNLNGWCDEPVTQSSYRAWMSAMHFGASDQVYLNWIPVGGPISGVGCSHSGLPAFYDEMVKDWAGAAPVYGFKHPDTGAPWGVWLQLSSNGGFDDALALEIIVSSLDHWKAQSSNSSRDLYNTLAGWVGDLVDLTCNGLAKLSPQAASSNPYIAAAKISSLLVCDTPGGTMPTPPLVPVVPPWWQSPTVLIGGAVAVLAAVLLAKHDRRATP